MIDIFPFSLSLSRFLYSNLEISLFYLVNDTYTQSCGIDTIDIDIDVIDVLILIFKQACPLLLLLLIILYWL